MTEARRASSVFPAGKLIPHEKPDFLLRSDERTIGIEVTELCREAPRAEGGRLAKIAERAQQSYSRSADLPVDVEAASAPNVEHVSPSQLVKGLTDFVIAHQNDQDGFDWNECELPEGYCYIGINQSLQPAGRWRIAKAFDTTVAPKELLDACIQGKNQLLGEYRATAREVWLLIINDKVSWGRGSACAA